MFKTILFSLIIFIGNFVSSQEILADVIVNYDQVQDARNITYTTLQKSLKDFINTTKWTDKRYDLHEKIECSFLIVINSRESSNEYSASISVQSRRPIFNSNYYSPILNLKDDSFRFRYTDFEALIFNERQFSRKNLTDVIAYYVYMILGYDADSFQLNGGTSFYKKAQQIANNSVAQGFSGWDESDGPRSRLSLANDILNSQSNSIRKLMYQYHRNGLDKMYQNPNRSKTTIGNSILQLQYYTKGNFTLYYPLDLFFFAKKEEVGRIFSGGNPSKVNIGKLKEILNRLSPTNSRIWDNLEK